MPDSPSAQVAAPAPTVRSRRASLGWLSLAHYLNDGAANYLPGVLPAILLAMNAPVALAGVLMASLHTGQALQPFTGILADRLGGRWQVAAGLLGTSCLAMLVGLAPNLWLLVPVLALLGVANAFFHPPALAVTRQLSDSRFAGRSMSIFLVGGELGRGSWPLLASGVVATLGLGWIGLLAIPGIVLALFLPARTPYLPPSDAKDWRLSWAAHFRPLLRIVAVSALRTTMILSAYTFLPLMWAARGASLVEGAGTISVVLLSGVIGNLAGGTLSDYLGRKRILLVGLGLGALALFGASVADGVWVWACLPVFGISLYATLPLTLLIAQESVSGNLSMSSGMALGFANGIGAVIVMLLGFAAAVFGIQMALWLAVGGGFVSLLLATGLREARRA